jgi:hypothetical protein
MKSAASPAHKIAPDSPQQRMSWREQARRGTVLFFFCLPFALFALWVYRYAANVPIGDDFDAILGFLNAFVQTDSLAEIPALLLRQHVEHRIVLVRAAALVQYIISGQANFRLLTFFGCLGWLITALVISLYVRKRYRLPLDWVLPIPYILLSFTTHLSMFWAMGSIQNYWVVLFSVLCLICLAEHKVTGAVLLFPCALFTSGTGIILYPLAAIYLLLQRKIKPFLLFVVPSTTFLLLFFVQYQRIGTSAAPDSLAAAAPWFLAFLGNASGYLPVAVAAGLLGLAGLLAIIVRSRDDFLRLLAAFIIVAAVTATLGRAGLGLAHAMSRHYAMYSLLAAVALYVFALTTITHQGAPRLALLVQIAAILFFAAVLVKYESAHYFAQMRTERLNSISAFAAGDEGALLIPSSSKGATYLREAERLGVYNYRETVH